MKKKRKKRSSSSSSSFTCLHPVVLVGIAALGIGLNVFMMTTLLLNSTST